MGLCSQTALWWALWSWCGTEATKRNVKPAPDVAQVGLAPLPMPAEMLCAAQGLRIAPPEAPVTGYMFGTLLLHSALCAEPLDQLRLRFCSSPCLGLAARQWHWCMPGAFCCTHISGVSRLPPRRRHEVLLGIEHAQQMSLLSSSSLPNLGKIVMPSRGWKHGQSG